MMADFQFGDELQLCLSIHYMKYYRFSQVYDSFYLLRQVKSLTPDSILFHSIMNNTYTHIYIDTHLSSFIFLLDLSQWLIFKYTHTHIYIYIPRKSLTYSNTFARSLQAHDNAYKTHRHIQQTFNRIKECVYAGSCAYSSPNYI